MIEMLTPGAATSQLLAGPISFKTLQVFVGGMVELHVVRESGKLVDVVCNEEGLLQGLPFNELATARFRHKLNIGPNAVGVWVVLSGRDRLK